VSDTESDHVAPDRVGWDAAWHFADAIAGLGNRVHQTDEVRVMLAWSITVAAVAGGLLPPEADARRAGTSDLSPVRLLWLVNLFSDDVYADDVSLFGVFTHGMGLRPAEGESGAAAYQHLLSELLLADAIPADVAMDASLMVRPGTVAEHWIKLNRLARGAVTGAFGEVATHSDDKMVTVGDVRVFVDTARSRDDA
jgi:hypothetical protein